MTSERREKWQGRNWCRPATRLAIYLRDGLACLWCQDSLENGAALSLDHRVPVARGGSNDPGNLLTSCMACNMSRGTKSVARFALITATAQLEKPATIEARVRNAVRRKLPRKEARSILARRAVWSDALAAAAQKEAS